MKKVILVCAVFSLLSGGFALQTEAEVRVRTGLDGEYDSTVIIPGGPPWRQGVWSSRSRGGLRRGSAVLNPLGDRFGDLYPSVGEQSQAPHHPWVVWSRFNGNDYDLVYSCWTYAWRSVSRVTSESLGGDDLDASVAFSDADRPWVAWWNRDLEDGHGSVYYSIFAGTGWIDPIKISDDSVGGRHPTITAGAETMLIEYDSDDGLVRMRHELALVDPSTITDDIDPQGTLDGPVEVGKEIKDKG